ncbi:MAG: hypothetical protein J1E81_05155 [Eubacterium sp.]|nr:hypothetical protein [Eubacterium sp.]
MLEYFEYTFEFLISILASIYEFILENKVIFDVVFIGIAGAIIILIIDFIFNIRDEFGEFNKFRDEPYMRYKYRYGRYKNKKDRLDIYELYRQNVDYNHQKSMERLHYYRESENIRHEHKHEEFDMFNQNKLKLDKAKKPKPNIDIEYEEDN